MQRWSERGMCMCACDACVSVWVCGEAVNRDNTVTIVKYSESEISYPSSVWKPAAIGMQWTDGIASNGDKQRRHKLLHRCTGDRDESSAAAKHSMPSQHCRSATADYHAVATSPPDETFTWYCQRHTFLDISETRIHCNKWDIPTAPSILVHNTQG